MKRTELVFGSNQYRQSVHLRDEVLRKPLGLEFSQSDLDAETDQHHLALIQNSEVVAVLLIKPLNPTAVKMRQVAVTPKEQGKGLGKELVSYSEDWALEHGYQSIELHAREVAVPFYLNLNYEVVSERFTEVGIPHFKMRKFLEQ
jgi:predicted GNAT family N-acyltransferase